MLWFHKYNPWGDKCVYIPHDVAITLLAQPMRSYIPPKSDCYLLASVVGAHTEFSLGIRQGPKPEDYLSPLCNQQLAARAHNDFWIMEQPGRTAMNARAAYALERGWMVVPHPQGRDHGPDRFQRGKLGVWDTFGPSTPTRWARAEMSSEGYWGHLKSFVTFWEAMDV